MAEIKIGSSDWWTQTADKVIGTGLDVLRAKLVGIEDTSGSNAPYVSASTPTSKYLPFVLGAGAVGLIVLIMAKR